MNKSIISKKDRINKTMSNLEACQLIMEIWQPQINDEEIYQFKIAVEYLVNLQDVESTGQINSNKLIGLMQSLSNTINIIKDDTHDLKILLKEKIINSITSKNSDQDKINTKDQVKHYSQEILDLNKIDVNLNQNNKDSEIFMNQNNEAEQPTVQYPKISDSEQELFIKSCKDKMIDIDGYQENYQIDYFTFKNLDQYELDNILFDNVNTYTNNHETIKLKIIFVQNYNLTKFKSSKEKEEILNQKYSDENNETNLIIQLCDKLTDLDIELKLCTNESKFSNINIEELKQKLKQDQISLIQSQSGFISLKKQLIINYKFIKICKWQLNDKNFDK